MTYITTNINNIPITEYIVEFGSIMLNNTSPKDNKNMTKIFINGDLFAIHSKPKMLVDNLKKLRKEIDDQLPKPFNSLFDFYKHVLPSVIALATNPKNYYKVKLSSNND